MLCDVYLAKINLHLVVRIIIFDVRSLTVYSRG